MEVDALGLVCAFDDKSHRFLHLRNLMLDIDVLLSCFPSVSLVHVCRQANKAPHEMALRLDEEQIWLDDIPPSIVSILNSKWFNDIDFLSKKIYIYVVPKLCPFLCPIHKKNNTCPFKKHPIKPYLARAKKQFSKNSLKSRYFSLIAFRNSLLSLSRP